MNDCNFWNDELVREFAEYYRKKQGVDYSTWGECILDSFKQSKQQSKNNQDWEILEFTHNHSDYVLAFGSYERKQNGLTATARLRHIPISAEIKSVKVLSSGEIFSLGDKVADLPGDYYSDKSIAAFIIERNNMFAIMNDMKGTFLIQHIKKHKPILFTTEDNVAIYEGGEYWLVYSDTFQKDKAIAKGLYSLSSGIKILTFSTESACNEYILMNKPCLSASEIIKLCEEVQFHNRMHDRADEDYYAVYVSLLKTRLNEIAKQKINQ